MRGSGKFKSIVTIHSLNSCLSANKSDKNIAPIEQNDFDKEHIGPIEYFPRFIEPKYYPFYNQRGYRSPFVMVHFKEPKFNTLIYVECKAWAKNIFHDRINKRGLTSFELFIEKPTESTK